MFTGAEARAQVYSKGKFEQGMLRAPDWRVDLLVRSVSRCLSGTNFLRVQRHTVDKTQEGPAGPDHSGTLMSH